MMARPAFLGTVAFVLIGTAGPLVAQDISFETTTATYFEDSVLELEEERLKLVGGTEWLLGLPPLLPLIGFEDALVIVQRESDYVFGHIYIGGDSYVGVLVSGTPVTKRGRRTWVIRKLGEGAVLQTADGDLWSVDRFDHFNTRFWLPPYEVLIPSSNIAMINLEEGETIGVRLERDP